MQARVRGHGLRSGREHSLCRQGVHLQGSKDREGRSGGAAAKLRAGWGVTMGPAQP